MLVHFCCDIGNSGRNELILWIKTRFFEKKIYAIVNFPWSILFAKKHDAASFK